MYRAPPIPPDDVASRPPRYSILHSNLSHKRASISTTSISTSSASTAVSMLCLRSRRRGLRRRLGRTLSILLLSSFPLSLVRLTEAFSCQSPTSSTTVQPGQSVLLGWQVSVLDTFILDSLSAELFCMDDSGSQGGQWRSISTLFSNLPLHAPSGTYQFALPDCGALATSGSVKLVAQSSNILIPFQQTDNCYFAIQPKPVPRPEIQPPALIPPSSPTVSPTPQSTSPSTSGVARIPKIVITGSTSLAPTTTPSPANPSPTAPTAPPAPGAGGASTTTFPPSALPSTAPGSGSGGSGSGINPSSNPALGPPITTPSLFPNGNSNSSTDGGSHVGSEGGTATDKKKWVGPVVGGIAAILCLIILVVFIIVIRRRRRSRLVGLGGNDSKDIPWIITGGGAGAVMRESKRRFRIMRYPKERNFYKMEEEEDDGGEASIGEKGVDGMLSKSATTAGAKATDIENEKTGDMVVSERHLALPQKSRIESSVPFHLRGIPMPAEGSLSGAYSMSSNRSSYDASSVVRKYWEASMAARPGPYAHGGPSSTRDLEGGGYFDEGSIFDGSRDSESRMADILSLRTTGSGGSVADTTGSSGRYRYRRSTLNSLFGAQRSVTTISTQSSFPDSLMITEEEFLERVRQHELQMQLEQDGQYYDGRQDSYLSGSTISRSSSIPSLTSSNDPFKTFDSNGVLLDTNPFSDNRAASRASSQRSYWFS